MKETQDHLLSTEQKVFRINNFEPKLPESPSPISEEDAEFVLVYTIDKDDEEYGTKMQSRCYYLKELGKQGINFKIIDVDKTTNTQFILLQASSDTLFRISTKMSIRLPLKGTVKNIPHDNISGGRRAC